MNKTIRQYIGMAVAVLTYYIVHEGAHLLYALSMGVFKGINIMSLGVQIDVYHHLLDDKQMAIFCVVGAVSTLIVGYLLMICIPKTKTCRYDVIKACFYYVTIAMLFLDPIYFTILYRFVGGGDMNGVSLLVNEKYASSIAFGILLFNLWIFFKYVLKEYQKMFKGSN